MMMMVYARCTLRKDSRVMNGPNEGTDEWTNGPNEGTEARTSGPINEPMNGPVDQ